MSESTTFNEVKDWDDDLKFGRDNENLPEDGKIKKFFPECVEIQQATLEEDKKKGIDRWIVLQNGKRVSVDIKTRRLGAMRYWTDKDNPDIALELWSVVGSKVGWTLNSENQVDYILFQFQDMPDSYLIPFQLLRLAFIKHKDDWVKNFKTGTQESVGSDGNRWNSSCVFVPVKTLWIAICNISHST